MPPEHVDDRDEEIFRVFCEIFNDFPTGLSAIFQLFRGCARLCLYGHEPACFDFKTYLF